MLSIVPFTLDISSILELLDRKGVTRVNKCSDGCDTGDNAVWASQFVVFELW